MAESQTLQVGVHAQVLTPLDGRIDAQAIQHLFVACAAEFHAVCSVEQMPQWLPLQVDLAIRPDGTSIFQVHAPSTLAQTSIEVFGERLRHLRMPKVSQGVAAVWLAFASGHDPRSLIQQPFQEQPWPLDDLHDSRSPTPEGDQSARPEVAASDGELRPEEMERLQTLSDAELGSQWQAGRTSRELAAILVSRHVAAERWTAVVQLLDEFLAQTPDWIPGLLARGESHLRLRHTHPALQDFTRVTELQPTMWQGHYGRGTVYMALEAWPAADAELSAAIACGPASAMFHSRRAFVRWQLRQSQAAFEDLTRAVRLDPYDFEALTSRIDVAIQMASAGDGASSYSMEEYLDDLHHVQRFGAPNPRILSRLAEQSLRQGEADQAIDWADQAIRLDPNCGPALAIRGEAYVGKQEVVLAEADLTRAIDLGVVNSEILCSLASVHLIQEEYESAMRDADRALEINADFAPAYDLRGMARSKMSEPMSAMADFEKAHELAPQWHLPLVHLGELLLENDDVEEAQRAFARAVEADATEADGWYWLAVCELRRGNQDLALAHVNEAIRLDPDHLLGFATRASIRLMRRELREAVADLTEVITRDAESAPAMLQRATARMALGEFELARQDFDAVIELCPGLAAAYSGRGHAWIQIGEQDKAADDFREAIACEPHHANEFEIHRLLALASYHQRKERYEEAIAAANEALEFDPESRAARAVRAVAYWYDEQFVEAVEEFDRLLDQSQQPGSRFSALSSRGQAQVDAGDYEAGLADLNQALEHADTETPTHVAYVLSGRALAHAGLDQFDQAHADFSASIRHSPENAWVHYNHGRVYDKLGEPRKAALCFQLALALDEPALTPRKRARAEAYLAKHPLQP